MNTARPKYPATERRNAQVRCAERVRRWIKATAVPRPIECLAAEVSVGASTVRGWINGTALIPYKARDGRHDIAKVNAALDRLGAKP